MMNLALDHAENMETLAAAKKPNHDYMSAVEEFLWEIGADIETGAQKLYEEMEEITHKWRWITGAAVLIILIIASTVLWWKCRGQIKRFTTSQVIIILGNVKTECQERRVTPYNPIAVPNSVLGR
ncbi:hypothetical protein Tcan_13844 [Toxocara canis]|uniref:Uncharacterized protein n=1 Tax=Toxocara canis TaxID=6265 RepID=A0A0B2VG05_TOXCA|nr:hypothetical protein Tcan_13844 [Toxocara canis]